MTDFRNGPRTSLRVVWTRGKGCGELAAVLSDGSAARVTGDIESAIVSHQADLLVARRLSPRSLVSMATPSDFDRTRVRRVVAAVGGGPHSSLAAEVAHAVGLVLDVPARLLCAYRDETDRPAAVTTLYRLYEVAPGIDADLVHAQTPADFVSDVDDDALLVLGAPGGSWVQRMFLGPGARLISGAPAGAVVVRRAARRVYQVMDEPVYVSPMLGADDAVRLSEADVLPVVDRGMLVGSVRKAALQIAGSGVAVGSLIESPEAVRPIDGLRHAGEVAARQGGGPVAVVDDDGRLIGTVSLSAIRSSN